MGAAQAISNKAETATRPSLRLVRNKAPFVIGEALSRVREAVRGLPKAALFQLAEDGHKSLFEQLIGCIISIRTLDEVTLPAARRLLQLGSTPDKVAALPIDAIDRAIRPATFHRQKAERIRAIAERVLQHPRSGIKCEFESLVKLPGVGPKCAALAMGIACAIPRIGVDVHVHRVTHRWGYIQAPTPERAAAELEAKLPRRYWIELNALLVPFGKKICTGPLPKCSTCPVESMCQQVGVKRHA